MQPSKHMIILLCAALMILAGSLSVSALDISITSPEATTYNTTDVVLNGTTSNQSDTISYVLDNSSAVLLCENCSDFSTELENLSEENHTISVTATQDNTSVTSTVGFAVVVPEPEPEEPDITIHSPQDKTYLTSHIFVNVTVSTEAELSYRLDDKDGVDVCDNCSAFSTWLENVSDGDHTLRVYADDTVAYRDFAVNTSYDEDENETGNFTGEPHYAVGYNKLPQMYASGEVNASELLDILTTVHLNPGILNRLAKTDMLTEDQIDAIAEYQFLPQGIANKLFGWFLPDNDDVAKSLFKYYDLTEEQQEALLEQAGSLRGSTVKRIAKKYALSPEALDTMIAAWDEDVLTDLPNHQTLTQGNLDAYLAKVRDKKAIRAVVQNQVLNQEQQEELTRNYGQDKKIRNSLQQMTDALPPGQAKKVMNQEQAGDTAPKGNGNAPATAGQTQEDQGNGNQQGNDQQKVNPQGKITGKAAGNGNKGGKR